MSQSYLTFTDINSRQYNFQIPDEGVLIETSAQNDFENFVVHSNGQNLHELIGVIECAYSIIVAGKTIFNTGHVVAVQLVDAC